MFLYVMKYNHTKKRFVRKNLYLYTYIYIHIYIYIYIYIYEVAVKYFYIVPAFLMFMKRFSFFNVFLSWLNTLNLIKILQPVHENTCNWYGFFVKIQDLTVYFTRKGFYHRCFSKTLKYFPGLTSEQYVNSVPC